MTSSAALALCDEVAPTSWTESNPLIVMHIITSLQIGGTERMLQRLTRIHTPGVRHIVVQLSAGGEIGKQMRHDGVNVTDLGLTNSPSCIMALGRLLRLVWRLRPDVIQTWLYHADIVGVVLGRLMRTPVVWNIRASDHPGMHRLVVKVCAALSRLPVVVVANSAAGRAVHVLHGYRARKWCIIPNGFDTRVFAPSEEARVAVRRDLGLPSQARLVGMIARWDLVKDHLTFFEAIRRVIEEEPGTYAIVVGDGMDNSNPSVASAVASTGGRVIPLGRRDDVARLTAALDVACLTSVSEGFPNVVGEAMASEVPCVATDVGASREIISDTGIVVPTQDVVGVADAIVNLLRRPEAERRAMGQRARERIIQNFSLAAVSAAYIDIYRCVAGAS